MSQEKRDEFDAIRASIKQLERVFGGKFVIKEWQAGSSRYLKAVMSWRVDSDTCQTEQLRNIA